MFLISSISSSDDKLSGCFAFELAQLLKLIKTIIKLTIFNYSEEKVWQHWPTTSKRLYERRYENGNMCTEHVDQRWKDQFVCTSPLGIGKKVRWGGREDWIPAQLARGKRSVQQELKRVLKEVNVWRQSIWTCLLYPFSFPTIFDWVLAKQWMREIIPQRVPFPLKTPLRSSQVVSQFHIA